MVRLFLFLLWLFSFPICAHPGWFSWTHQNGNRLASFWESDEEVLRQIKSIPTHYSGPQIVQWANSPYIYSDTSINQATWNFPNPTLSGNCFVLCISVTSSISSVTITDSTGGSNTWSQVGSYHTTSNSYTSGLFIAPNCVSGTTWVNVAFGLSTQTIDGSFLLAEVSGIATSSPVDASNYANVSNSSTSWSTTLNTVADGDMILAFAIQDQVNIQTGGPFPGVTNYAAGANFTLLCASLSIGQAMQYWVQSTHNSSTSVGLTLTGGLGGSFWAVALKPSAGAGTPIPAGMRILGRQMENYSPTSGGASDANGPYNLQMPCQGNLLVLLSHLSTNGTTLPGSCTKSVTDSNSNTWKQAMSTSSSTISSISESGTVVTVNTSTNHGLSINSGNGGGDCVNISGCSVVGYNGNWWVVSVPSNTQFTYNCATSGLSSASNGTATQCGQYGSGQATIIPAACEVIFYAPNMTPSSNLTLTATLEGNPTHSANYHIYDVKGADPNPFDGWAATQGNQSSPGNLTLVSVTPNSTSGIIFMKGAQAFGTSKQLVGSTFQSDMLYGNATGGSNRLMDSDDPCGHCYYSSSSQQTFIATTDNPSGGVGTWAVAAVAFKAGASVSPGIPLPAAPVGFSIMNGVASLLGLTPMKVKIG